MKKIIASLLEWEKYEVASNAARAPYFIVFNNDKYEKSIKNPFVSWGWAGFAVAELLREEGCDLFVAWKVGWNLEEKLDEYGIKYEIK
jgi:predicted Fe-Mo cluster-binding NifX family protein